MSTRRSRIKAVANLPARRNRPPALNDKGDDLKCLEENKGTPAPKIVTEALPKDNDAKDCAKQNNIIQWSSSTSSQSLSDRKSVIVTVEKDRKSVIVNRDECPAITDPAGGKQEKQCDVAEGSSTPDSQSLPTISCCSNGGANVELKENSPTQRAVVCKLESPVENASLKSPDSEVVSDASNKRLPLRGRRSRPTVNLVAATRKRPTNDPMGSSPCSPPPCKVKGIEPLQQKASESNCNNETDKSSNRIDKSLETDLSDPKDVLSSKSKGIASPSPLPLSPQPVVGRCTSSSKVCPDTNGQFKLPLNPLSKNKEPLPGTSSENCSKGPAPMSPLKESSTVRRKTSTSAQRAAAARKNLKSRFSVEDPLPRSALTMFDLIFYNPSKNPMKSTDSPSTKSRPRLNSVASISSIHEDRLNEESVDDVEGDTTEENPAEESAMPVPRVKVGPDGSLILDEQSLVIETTGTKKSIEDMQKSEIVVDNGSSYGHYKKIIRSKDWSDHETKKFYRALNVVGTDFSLMKPYFRNRTRRELKLKFKKEERLNPNLINKALGEPLDFDITELEKECALEDEEEKREEELAKEKASEKSLEKTANDKERRVKKPVPKKRKRNGSVLFSEMELELESDRVANRNTEKGVVKKTKQLIGAEADYKILAKGVVNSTKDKSSQQCKNTNASVPSLETIEAPKEIVNSNTGPKPLKQTKKKPTPNIVFSSQSNIPKPGGSKLPLASVSQPQIVQQPNPKTPSSLTCTNSVLVTRAPASTPISQIRTVLASPQMTPPLSGFGMTTPVNRLLPSTPSLSRMEPGSIIVLKTPLPQNPDRHVLQVYMVTNTPSATNSSSIPHSPVPGISVIPATAVPATPRSAVLSDDSDSEKVMTKL